MDVCYVGERKRVEEGRLEVEFRCWKEGKGGERRVEERRGEGRKKREERGERGREEGEERGEWYLGCREIIFFVERINIVVIFIDSWG